MVSLIDSPPCILKAIDICADILDDDTTYNDNTLLLDTIVLKKGILVELIGGNYSIEDGLVNGSDGLFMHFTSRDIDIVWIDFGNPSIGEFQQKSMDQLYTDAIAKDWTPIPRISRKILIHKKPSIRQQFPVQVACARTIHRSQGLTMDRLAFDPI